MGNVDSTSKVFVQKSEVFQDVFKLVFNDAQATLEKIQPMEPEAFFAQMLPATGETKRIRKRRKAQKALMLTRFSRDIVKNCVCATHENVDYMVLAIENQAYVDHFMPARVMIYDAMTLHTQIKCLKALNSSTLTADTFLTGVSKGTKLKPVLTVVCYFGEKPWDGPRSLHEILEINDPKLKALIPDYPIIIIDPHALTEAQLGLLDTSLREVFTCIKDSHHRKSLKEIVNSNPRFQHMDPDAVNLIKAVLNIDIQTDAKQGEINMCQAVEDWKQELLDEGRTEGKAEGKAEALVNLMQNFKLNLDQALSGLSIPTSEWDAYRERVQKLQTAQS